MNVLVLSMQRWHKQEYQSKGGRIKTGGQRKKLVCWRKRGLETELKTEHQSRKEVESEEEV